jgi:outer membrane protein OmpA-like peptidoglycan-associated protein
MNKFIFSVLALVFVIIGWKTADNKLQIASAEQKPILEKDLPLKPKLPEVKSTELKPEPLIISKNAKNDKFKVATATLAPKARARLASKVKPNAVIYFETANSSLSTSEQKKLDRLLIDFSNIKKIELNAYNDSTGTKAESKKVSQQRLSSIINYLKSKQILTPISARSFDSTYALDSNKTAIGRANNRRIEIILSK